MDEKKLEIIERASFVYMKYGVKSVTMDDLARELGTSKKTIYKYFKDKQELINEIISIKVEMDSSVCGNCIQKSENAIDELIKISQLVIEQFRNVNPTVFFDLRKYHPDAWSKIEEHKWKFVRTIIYENVERGMRENIYRNDLNPDIIANLYVSTTDNVMNGEIFPWPAYKFQEVFFEMIQLYINGMSNDKGKAYLKKRLNQKNDTN